MSLPVLPGLDSLGGAFRAELESLARRLGIDAAELAASMYLESSFNPRAVNPVSGAVGLIQWTSSTARDLQVTPEAILAMTPLEQLALVERYLRPYAPKIRAGYPGDVYVAIFSPRYIAHGGGVLIAARGSTAYDNNAHLDANHDDKITVAEARARVLRVLGRDSAALTAGLAGAGLLGLLLLWWGSR